MQAEFECFRKNVKVSRFSTRIFQKSQVDVDHVDAKIATFSGTPKNLLQLRREYGRETSNTCEKEGNFKISARKEAAPQTAGSLPDSSARGRPESPGSSSGCRRGARGRGGPRARRCRPRRRRRRPPRRGSTPTPMHFSPRKGLFFKNSPHQIRRSLSILEFLPHFGGLVRGCIEPALVNEGCSRRACSPDLGANQLGLRELWHGARKPRRRKIIRPRGLKFC